jgi:hypothetical protein
MAWPKHMEELNWANVILSNCSEANTQANISSWFVRLSRVDDPVPEDLLECHDPATVNKWLCRYVLETRQENGSNYPPKSIYSLLCGIQRVTRENNVPFSFLDKNDLRFKDLHRTLDSICSDLHSRGIGADVRSALVISYEHEDMFWQSGALGYCSPRILFYTIFFYAGLSFCLRGGQEQRDLTWKNFKRLPDDTSVYDDNTYYEYLFLRTINIDSMRYIWITNLSKCMPIVILTNVLWNLWISTKWRCHLIQNVSIYVL